MTSYLTSLSAWRQQPIPVASGSSKPIKRASADLNAQIAATPSFQFQDDTPPASDEEEEEPIPSDEEPSFPARNSAQRQNGLGLPPSTNAVPKKPRRKVALEPGYSQLDWAKLKSSGKDLRGGVTQLSRITREELAQHKKKDDCWSAFQGKVYNITPYLKFHPGGVPELMRVAGKDGTELFMKTHAWINAENMLDSTMVGILVN